jgi:hypothetical protein
MGTIAAVPSIAKGPPITVKVPEEVGHDSIETCQKAEPAVKEVYVFELRTHQLRSCHLRGISSPL